MQGFVSMKVSQVRRFALSLPEVSEEPHFDYSSFRVRGRIFVTVPPDEAHIHVFVGDDAREMALLRHPDFLEKLFWGGKVCGLRVRLAAALPSVVNRLIQDAWIRKAPKRLAATLPGLET
jgi:hypothetical protein